MNTETRNKHLLIGGGLVLFALLVILITAGVVFRSPLPNWAAKSGEVAQLTSEQRNYVDFVASHQAQFSEPLTFEENEQLVLGGIQQTCKSAMPIVGPYGTTQETNVTYLAMRGHLFAIFPGAGDESQQRRTNFVINALDRFC